MLEAELAARPLGLETGTLTQAGISAAVAWDFLLMTRPDRIDPAAHPALVAHHAAAEQLTAFVTWPAQ